MPTLLPIFLELARKRVLLVGGGHAAREKLEKLLPTGALIELIALSIRPETQELLDMHQIPWQKRAFEAADAEGRFLVISAVNDARTHAVIAAEARRRHTLVNTVDAPLSADFYFGAQVQRGALQIAISTHGLFPGVARALRLWLEEALPAPLTLEFDELVRLRRRAQELLPDPLERMKALKDQLEIWTHQGQAKQRGVS